MKVLEPGHLYELKCLDGRDLHWLRFVKRIGPGYPGNEPPAYSGTTMQEVLRALIERSEYVNGQVPCVETESAIGLLRSALVLFEIRAKRVKGKHLTVRAVEDVIDGATCPKCGHVQCDEAHV
jgi:hypothetical protein